MKERGVVQMEVQPVVHILQADMDMEKRICVSIIQVGFICTILFFIIIKKNVKIYWITKLNV